MSMLCNVARVDDGINASLLYDSTIDPEESLGTRRQQQGESETGKGRHPPALEARIRGIWIRDSGRMLNGKDRGQAQSVSKRMVLVLDSMAKSCGVQVEYFQIQDVTRSAPPSSTVDIKHSTKGISRERLAGMLTCIRDKTPHAEHREWQCFLWGTP